MMGLLSGLSSLLGWNDNEGLALTRTGELLEQCTQIGWFELLESARTILGGIAKRVGIRAHERAHRLAVAEIDPLHGDDLVDDRWQLASGLGTLDLRLPGRDVELVDVLFQHRHKDNGLLARVLELVEPADHAACVQSVDAAQILAAAVAGRFRLLLRPGEAEPP